MRKTAVVTDSNSGITQEEAKALGITVLPMPFIIDGENYLEGVTLTQEEFYKRLNNDADVSTSQPSLVDVTDCWDRLLKEYDEIVHIPMSSALSSSCATATMLSGNYDGKVQVVNNQRISVTQKQSVLDALEMTKAGISAERIKNHLEKTRFDSSIYVTVETLKYLKKGGRITPAAAAMASLLKIKPILQIQGEKLDSFSKARTKKQSKKIMMSAVLDDMKNRFGASDDGHEVWLEVVYSGTDTAEAEEFRRVILEDFPNHPVHISPISLSIACHIGDGILAVACTKKLNINDVQ